MNEKNASRPPIDHISGESDAPSASKHHEEVKYPPLRTVILVMLALYIAMFLVALDRIIISTAIPRITDAFHSIDDIGWYGSAYVLTSSATQLLWGRLNSFYNNKAVFLAAVGLFEVGSALCGAAPNSIAFILGRAIAGSGSAGVFSSVVVIMIPLVPLAKRPMYQGFLGAIFGISSVIGPLVGGAFTNSKSLTWRWCFYINLPIGAVSVFIILFFLHLPAPPKASISAKDKLKGMDPLGTFIFLPSIVCLLLALQWGGSTYAWSNARIIVLFVVFGISIIAWVYVQHRGGDNATVPPRVFLQRSIMAGFGFSCCVGGTMLASMYYVPIWFQAIKGVDALQSGIRTLPFVLGITVGSILSGGLTSRFGYYAPFVIASSCLMSVGTGLLTILRVHSGSDKWIGFQALLGLGMGMGMQAPGLAAQTVLPGPDISTGVAVMFFGQSLGGAVFVCVAQTVFLQRLTSTLSAVLPGSQVSEIINGVGATGLRGSVPVDKLPAVLVAYNKAIVTAFYVAVGVACFSIVPALSFEWRSVKAKRGPPAAAAAAGREEDVEAGRKSAGETS
ncbi:Major facilitator superfamily domain, general substrate transporter [Pleurostoma richardsiae]|uniref:Major facilitator superfamily domain, general substrate transporter n=1 Tax=Pleurostoma richardsiae TaxID=41990 RepID=A0AA38S1Z3_9PEZI|nr:Major facilitator superfamily domain, general substrate transporter [Pleurostoma richardsiae]